MRSSGSTHSPRRDPRARLFIVLAGEDHPRACTGRRLLARGLARRVLDTERLRPAPVLLDPYAPEPLGGADRAAVARGGVLAVDCSWNRLSERGQFPTGLAGAGAHAHRRRLPLLVATNPQHYGRLAQLNTAEALAAALLIVGRPAEARDVLAGFGGANSFFEVNDERFRAYAKARNSDAVRAEEQRLFGGECSP
jgi:pre-rRNA-processing protein TSR3